MSRGAESAALLKGAWTRRTRTRGDDGDSGRHLPRRRHEMDDDPDDLLRLAGRAEFDGHPLENVRAWLEERGVEL